MSYSVVEFIEKGTHTEGVVPTNWIKDGRVFWSDSVNAGKESKQRIELKESWPSFQLIKRKFSDGNFKNYTSCSLMIPQKTY